MGGFIVAAIGLTGFAASVVAFAINMVISSIISSVFAPKNPGLPAPAPNPGNPQQLPPAGDNKLPVLYGEAYTGGIVVDMSITSDNQDIYWVLALCEVTNTEPGVSVGSADNIDFGNIYWGGKKVVFGGGGNTTQNIQIGNIISPAISSITSYQVMIKPTRTISIVAGDIITFGTSPTTYIVSNTATLSGSTLPQPIIITLTTTPPTVTNNEIIYLKRTTTNPTTSNVTGLLDESTGNVQDVTGNMDIYLYRNGSNNPVNTNQTAIQVMNSANLVYKWSSAHLMSNCAFAIIHLKYNQNQNLTGLNQTRFQIFNSRSAPGDCFYDFFTSKRYGAALPTNQVDTTSLNNLNTYSNQSFTYTDYNGITQTQKRFAFNGVLYTTQKIMQNIQSMADCCDCLVKYNEVTGLWGVIVQTPSYTVAMDINNSNTIGSIQVSPIDISNSFNIIQVNFPDGSQKDSFTSATFDLATINPSLLFPNEPVNQQSVNLYLSNNNVQSQYLANRMLEAAREDLQVSLEVDYSGLQLEAGDVVTLTNANYGWVAKLFRIAKVVQKYGSQGEITATLNLMEYNPSVYDDKNITQFTPAPNTGIGSPTAFGTVPAPVITASYPAISVPSILITATSSSAGITQYAEIWYSIYKYPTQSQLIFAGTTAINPNGDPYGVNVVMPSVEISAIPAGNYYFFSRMVNSLASSSYSPASDLLNWRPRTFQYLYDYLSIGYADDANGSGFSLNPRNKIYYGILNQSSTTPSTNPSDYEWYLADPSFGTNKYLCYANRSNLKFSFDTDFAAYASGSGAFVPTTVANFDPKLWSALPDGTNIINCRATTGQFIGVGNTTTGTGQIKIVNTNDGQVVASLDQFLDFGGATTKTGSAATLTIDIYGRVVGFTTPDNFYMTIDNFTATSGQTVFSVTRDATYITGQCWVFKNGCLLNTSEYTDASSSVTLGSGAALNDKICIVSMRAISSGNYYADTYLAVSSVASAVVTWNSSQMPYQYINAGDKITFANTGTPTQYTVSSVDYVNRQITFTTSVTGVSTGANIYTYRAANSSYPVFSRFDTDLTSASSYTPTEWAFDSGYELPFFNGTVVPDQDYDIVGNTYTNMPSTATGHLSIIQFNQNNLTTPVGTPVNVIIFTEAGVDTYAFTFTANALDLYANGVLLVNTLDYNIGTNNYTLTSVPDNSMTVLQQQTLARAGAA